MAVSAAEVEAMKVPELKAALEAAGLSSKGLKKDLTERLLEHLQSQDGSGAAETAAEASAEVSSAKENAPAANNNNNTAAESAADAAASGGESDNNDDDDDDGAVGNGAAGGNSAKRDKNRRKKLKKKQRQAQQKAAAPPATTTANGNAATTATQDTKNAVVIEYVPEKIELEDPTLSEFAEIFKKFQTAAPEEVKEEIKAEETAPAVEVDTFKADEEEKADEAPKLSNKKLRKLTRLTVAQLKQLVARPDLVERHDVTAADPKLLLHLKSTRNTVPVPRHWCLKRKYLQGKRGIEKPPFTLPDFIQKTGITEMRETIAEKEERMGLKGKMREKVRPKMGKIDIDYQKLHDAFFRWQTKPKMTIHGDIYYEGKEFEVKMTSKRPGKLSDELKIALGMPTEPDAAPLPPPWLLHMQRFGPPPSYPNLKIPGLNAPIPAGCSFGYQPGGWGKPPVDEQGKPLYGDVFVSSADGYEEQNEDDIEIGLWGEVESAAEESSEEEESEEEGEEEEDDGLETPGGAVSETPSGLSSTSKGMETPDAIELRKRRIEDDMDETEERPLYHVVPEKASSVGSAMMGSSHVYDLKNMTAVGAKSGKPMVDGVEVAVEDPDDLANMDQEELARRYESSQKKPEAGEDFSDLFAEHAKKRKTTQKAADKSAGTKKFKF
eukprot:m.159603 g.159603  ORF g.159603 m.159603 type:complete len:665 (-) comp17043_c1_seq1:136-2130(-)